MTTPFPQLLSPGRIGTLKLRNRILMCPMGDALALPDGTVSDRQLDYYEARARGGAALLIVGSVAVSYPAGSFAATQTAISTDECLPGLTSLAERAHRHAAAIAAQLVHVGPQALFDIAEGRPLLVPSSPSPPRLDPLSMMLTPSEREAMMQPFAQPTSKVSYHEATADDLARVAAQFADAADRARRAGFDGIELHAGHGYLIDAFRSGASNHRDDEWGGSVAGRARLLLDVIKAVRGRVGAEFPVWCRLNALERYREGGETLEETLEVAHLAVDAGLDALHVSAYANPYVAVGITEAHTPHEPGALLAFAATVKAAVDVPVITFGRLEPEAAEAALASGQADLVGMGRQLLADPDLPRKLAEGRRDDVRPCIYQYRCIGNIFLNTHVACVANPRTAREGELAPRVAPTPRAILVAGAGPAGLESARLLAEAGHRVVVVDARERLGGRLALAARADPALDRMLGWLTRSVEAAGVELRLGVRVDVSLARELDCDEVVVATGAHWAGPSWPGADAAAVLTLDDLQPWADHDNTTVGEQVVVVGGGKAGLSLASIARSRGRTVTVLEPDAVLAPQLGLPGRFRWVRDLELAGVELVTGASVRSVTDSAVHWTDTDGAEQATPAHTVIVASGACSDLGLLHGLQDAGIAARAVGDCVDPRGIEGALLDAAALVAVGASEIGPAS